MPYILQRCFIYYRGALHSIGMSYILIFDIWIGQTLESLTNLRGEEGRAGLPEALPKLIEHSERTRGRICVPRQDFGEECLGPPWQRKGERERSPGSLQADEALGELMLVHQPRIVELRPSPMARYDNELARGPRPWCLRESSNLETWRAGPVPRGGRSFLAWVPPCCLPFPSFSPLCSSAGR